MHHNDPHDRDPSGRTSAFLGVLAARLRTPALLAVALGMAVTACSSSETTATTTSSPVPTTAKVTRRDVRVVDEFDGTLGLSDERSIVYQAEQPADTSSTTPGATGQAGSAPGGAPPSSTTVPANGAGTGAGTGSGPTSGTGQQGTFGPTTTPTYSFGGSTDTTTTTPPTTAAPTTTTTTTPTAARSARGTVSFVSAATSTQSAPPSGSGGGASSDKMVTAVASVGSTVSRGQVLYRVDDQPTFLMIGSSPAYRELSTGSSDGADVRQLEDNLVALGFGDGLTVDDDFTSATASAVTDWEDSVGLDGDGIVELGQVVFTDGAVQVRSITSPVGTMVSIGTEIMTVSSKQPVVTIAATLPETSTLEPGTAVEVELHDGTKVPGRVASIGRDTTSAEGADVTDATVELTVALDDAEAIDESTLTGAVTVRDTVVDHPDVLTVPTSAVMTAHGRSVVHRVTGDGSGATSSTVTVEVGPSADGFVEISGSGIRKGDRVSLVPAAPAS